MKLWFRRRTPVTPELKPEDRFTIFGILSTIKLAAHLHCKLSLDILQRVAQLPFRYQVVYLPYLAVLFLIGPIFILSLPIAYWWYGRQTPPTPEELERAQEMARHLQPFLDRADRNRKMREKA